MTLEIQRKDFDSNEEYVYALLSTYCSDRLDVDKFMNWLVHTDYFIAPASTKYHLDCVGGLFIHSVHVMENLIFLADHYIKDVFDVSTYIICGLFHDICKTNFYKIEKKWTKDSSNRWTQYDTYVVDDEMPLGHGEKSVILLMNAGCKLSYEEMLAIRWHMSGFDKAVQGGELALNKAYDMTKLVGLLQAADLLSTTVVEN